MVLGRVGGITTKTHMAKWRFIVCVAALGVLTACGGGSSGTVNSGLKFSWVSGSDTANASGVYGTQGTSTASNIPGGRCYPVRWTDANGNLWLFGGNGYDSVGSIGVLNDLWEFNPSNNQWTWVSGSNTGGAKGVYGSQGAPSASNVPGARDGAVGWSDASGNLWLFGGYGYDSAGSLGELNDLWEYSPLSGEWTWVSGSNTANASGVYGTQGTPAVGNVPRARYGAVSWTDASGNLWLFGGGFGFASELNDLWMYSPLSGQWTWMGGSNAVEANGVYGTQGTPSASNIPGARQGAISWTDASGNLWLFGGARAFSSEFNDLWKYSPSSGEWTWMSGSNTANATSVYGTLGTPAAGNVPSARDSAVSWIDASGNLWLFGGSGYVYVSSSNFSGVGSLNDLWEYSPSDGQWAWMGGSNTVGASGVYGTQGTPSAKNIPGARYDAVGWTDASGNLWLFGGTEPFSSITAVGIAYFNDLWSFHP